MRIAITGASGFLGSRIQRQLEAFSSIRYDVFPYTRADLDFTKQEQVMEVLRRDLPDILIHTAAVSDIKEAEENPEVSEMVNVTGVRYLAEACRECGIRMIFCSSDQVYMGSPVREAHREEEENLVPVSLYAGQKLRAEKIVSDICSDSVILRLSWMFADDFRAGKEHGNLVSNIAGAVRNKQKMCLPVYDYRSITDVRVVAENMEKMFGAAPGVYNFGSENELSTYELVRELMVHFKMPELIPEKNVEAFAECPRNLRMDMRKCREIGVDFPDALSSLKQIPAESIR